MLSAENLKEEGTVDIDKRDMIIFGTEKVTLRAFPQSSQQASQEHDCSHSVLLRLDSGLPLARDAQRLGR